MEGWLLGLQLAGPWLPLGTVAAPGVFLLCPHPFFFQGRKSNGLRIAPEVSLELGHFKTQPHSRICRGGFQRGFVGTQFGS